MPLAYPPIFQAIAAMSENRVIGNKGKIPWHLPEDFRWFKHKTMGGTLIMGRKTFESIGKPLPGRKTIVLTRGNTPIPEVQTISDWKPLRQPTEDGPHNYWVCGGAQIYAEMLPICAYLYLTRVKRTVAGDTFFPEFETTFRLIGTIHENTDFRLECWLNPQQGWRAYNPVDLWPFPSK